ncbi:MAG: TetR family transcriptional regulator, partial [Phenylobacterium sp.]
MIEELTEAAPGGRRERTCAALIDAAFELVSERGFPAVSLEDIASRAGLTKGAIYSNFKGRSELLMAMCEAKAPTLRPRFAPGARLRVQLRACAEALIEDLIGDPARARFMTEYHRHAQEDLVFGRALQERYEAMFNAMGVYFEACPDRLALPGRALAVMTQALMVGLVEQWRLTPGQVTAP